MVGIIGAMQIEVEKLIEAMEETRREEYGGILFSIGKISGTACVIAQCGVGKVFAAVCAQTMILRYQPDCIINVGVAGGIGEGVQIGDLVVATGFVQHDMDTSPLGDPIGMISGIQLVELPASERLCSLITEAAHAEYGAHVHRGIIASGDQFVCSAERLKEVHRRFGASACEMESAAIAQVCYCCKVECSAIRAISDHADSDASVDFVRFAEDAADKTAALMKQVLPQL